MDDKKITYGEIAKCVRKYESCAYKNIGSINLIEDLRLSKNVHETAHSRLLYKFLLITGGDNDNPYPLLKEFLKILDCPWKDEKLDNVIVQPEMEHIDVLIAFGEHAIVIENKVNRAKDQDRQIKTYYEKLKMGVELRGKQTNFTDENIYVLYLTRMASDPDPSESSLPEDLKEKLGEHYKKISYEREIRDWLRSVEQNLRKENQISEHGTENVYSALVQYSLFLDNMFNENMEENCIMTKNINEALNLDATNLASSFDKVKQYIAPAKDFVSKLENYFVSVVLRELREGSDSVDCRGKDSKKVEFAIAYKNGQKFLGIANVDPIDDDGYWFAIGKAEERNCAILWEGGKAIDDNQTIKDCFENAFKKGLKAKLVNKSETKNFDTYHIFSDTDPYPYWKYCSSIEKLIEEIKKFVQYINVESEAN